MHSISIQLPTDLDQFVQAQVASGDFRSEQELLEAAVRLLRDRAEQKMARLSDLKRELQIGIDQLERGETTAFDAEAILAEAARRVSDRERTS